MKFGTEAYLSGFFERKNDYFNLKSNNPDALILRAYIGGVALECLLRHRRVLKNKEFDEKHDLVNLYKSSEITECLSDDENKVFREQLPVIAKYWHNNLRYCSLAQFRKNLGHASAKTSSRNINYDCEEKLNPFFEAMESVLTIGAQKKWN